MRAPPESLIPITGQPYFTARSITLQIFSANTSLSEPPNTVKSCEKTKTLRPKIVPYPVTTASPYGRRSSIPKFDSRWRTKRSSSTNEPGSRSSIRRSRASSFPCSRWRSIARSDPPCSDSSRSCWRRSSFASVESARSRGSSVVAMRGAYCLPLVASKRATTAAAGPAAARVRAAVDGGAHDAVRRRDGRRGRRMAGVRDPPQPARPRARRPGRVHPAPAARAPGRASLRPLPASDDRRDSDRDQRHDRGAAARRHRARRPCAVALPRARRALGCRRGDRISRAERTDAGDRPDGTAPGAVALRSVAGQIAIVAGPAVGGLLFAISAEVVYAVAVTLLCIALVAVLGLRHRPAVVTERAPGFDELVAGVRFVLRTRILLGAIALDLFAVLFGGAVALLPVYARTILDVGPVGLGVLRTAPAVGALAAAVLLARRPLRRPAGPTLLLVVAIFGVAIVVFGLSNWFPLSLVALGVSGFADMISVNIRSTTAALVTPNELRGRVLAVEWVFISASNELGAFESGVVASLVGTMTTVVAGGLATIGIALSWTRLFPSLARMGRLEDLRPEPV